MKHLNKGRKFHRKRGKRKAFLKTLAHNLIMREKIQTTTARAKEIKPQVERLVTYGKKQNLAGLRLLIQKLPKVSANKVYYEIAPRYKTRPGGYLRITRTAKTRADGSDMSIIEFVK